MQDNAPTHTYKWFETTGYKVMEWPPNSPDMNPNEYVWVHLKGNLHKYYPEFANMLGDAKTIKPKLVDVIIHCSELLGP